jgi:hypothetical protein
VMVSDWVASLWVVLTDPMLPDLEP